MHPFGMRIETPSTAVKVPKRLTTPSRVSAWSMGEGSWGMVRGWGSALSRRKQPGQDLVHESRIGLALRGAHDLALQGVERLVLAGLEVGGRLRVRGEHL